MLKLFLATSDWAKLVSLPRGSFNYKDTAGLDSEVSFKLFQKAPSGGQIASWL